MYGDSIGRSIPIESADFLRTMLAIRLSRTDVSLRSRAVTAEMAV